MHAAGTKLDHNVINATIGLARAAFVHPNRPHPKPVILARLRLDAPSLLAAVAPWRRRCAVDAPAHRAVTSRPQSSPEPMFGPPCLAEAELPPSFRFHATAAELWLAETLTGAA